MTIRKLIVLSVLLFHTSVKCQNMVLNGSMEIFFQCPNAFGQLNKAVGWYGMDGYGGSSEYFNACANPGLFGVPSNGFGFQNSRNGHAYIGMHFFNPNSEYCEYSAGTLMTPLDSGVCYSASMHISLSTYSSFAIDAIGLFFTTDSLFKFYSSTPVEVTPHIANDSGNIISDTANWVKISGSFIATGGEKFFTIGRFKRNEYVNYEVVIPYEGYSYYYIDDVAVWPCDAPVYTANGGGNRQVCNAGDMVTLGTHNLPEYEYHWFDADSNLIDTTATITVAPFEDCIYYLMVRDFKYDITWDTVRITMGCEGSLYVPNIFSPNGDGNNDVLYVRGQNLKELSFAVYNRWGQLVFESKDKDAGWDGKYKGKDCPEGVYFYTVNVTFVDGSVTIKNGNVSIVR
jgi:gliding motility-associated-like protein